MSQNKETKKHKVSQPVPAAQNTIEHYETSHN